MKQLISQSKIDEAAEKSSLKTIKDLPIKEMRSEMSAMEWSSWFEDEFKSGVQFALNEIEPLMVEFAEWSHNKIVRGTYIGNLSYEDMMKEFINYKNKENE